MTHTNSEAQALSRPKVCHPDRRVPFGVRWLAYLSTSRWRSNYPVHPNVAACAARMETDGWMIRGAWARNYLLWRNGRTIRETQLPLLILPLAYGRLSTLQINVFLTVEMMEAESGLQQGCDRESFPHEAASFQSALDLIAAETGIIIADPFRIHREALRTVQQVIL